MLANKCVAKEGYIIDWADLTAHQHEDENGNLVQDHLYATTLYLGVNDKVENYVQFPRYVKHTAAEGKVYDYIDADSRAEHLLTKEIEFDITEGNFEDIYVEVDEKGE
jgi:hypothetical protein